MKSRLCTPVVPQLKDAKGFLHKFGISLLRAYLSSQLSYEMDRKNAVTAVATSILRSRGSHMSGDELMEHLWTTNGSFWARSDSYFASEVNADLLHNPCGIKKLQLGGTFVSPIENRTDRLTYGYNNVEGEAVEKRDNNKGAGMISFAVRNNMSMRVSGLKIAEDLVGSEHQDDGRFRSAGFNGDGGEVEFVVCSPPPGGLPLSVVFVANRGGRIYAMCIRKTTWGEGEGEGGSQRPQRDLRFF